MPFYPAHQPGGIGVGGLPLFDSVSLNPERANEAVFSSEGASHRRG